MKKIMLLCALIVTFVMPITSNAQLGGLIKKGKDKVTKAAKSETQSATTKAIDANRPPLPWPMQDKPYYNGMDAHEFLQSLASQSKESVETLRELLYARYKSNAKIINSNGPKYMEAKQENERFWSFVSSAQTVISINISGVDISSTGAITQNGVKRLVTGREGGGIGYYVVGDAPGEYRFVTLGMTGAYLNDEELAVAKNAALRMRRMQDLFKGLHVMLEEVGEQCDYRDRYIYNLAGIYAMGVEEACNKNTPANIQRRAMPKAGALNSSLKASALKVAKAQNPNVVDVVITSDNWDVKRKGGVISHRSVYGYYVVQDANGKKCLSRSWTQSYMGGGKYDTMRAGGVGVEADFYVK